MAYMALIEQRLEIAAERARVYEVSQDYAVRYQWDPFPERIAFVGALQTVQRGARVEVVARSGLRMEVEFVQVDAPQRAAIRMLKGPLLLKQFAGSWVFSELGPQRTQAVFRYNLKVQPWALPWLLEPLAVWYFRRAVVARMRGLKNYCEQLVN
ncbi:SRPBCC family protein [Aquipseudomonas campi]|uniref:SRPBCC family protein n=2 Tax=Aquipseudomonas campi TaxID=2731681 RepID=A0A6M8FEC8_9GAMM|nr:SRPBCC family protein [Pseudomonas campi]